MTLTLFQGQFDKTKKFSKNIYFPSVIGLWLLNLIFSILEQSATKLLHSVTLTLLQGHCDLIQELPLYNFFSWFKSCMYLASLNKGLKSLHMSMTLTLL